MSVWLTTDSGSTTTKASQQCPTKATVTARIGARQSRILRRGSLHIIRVQIHTPLLNSLIKGAHTKRSPEGNTRAPETQLPAPFFLFPFLPFFPSHSATLNLCCLPHISWFPWFWDWQKNASFIPGSRAAHHLGNIFVRSFLFFSFLFILFIPFQVPPRQLENRRRKCVENCTTAKAWASVKSSFRSEWRGLAKTQKHQQKQHRIALFYWTRSETLFLNGIFDIGMEDRAPSWPRSHFGGGGERIWFLLPHSHTLENVRQWCTTFVYCHVRSKPTLNRTHDITCGD